MITREYIVALINGDYAILEDENKEQISIARALLPMEIDEGTRLLFENFQYTIITLKHKSIYTLKNYFQPLFFTDHH